MDLVFDSPRDRVTGITTDTEHDLDKSLGEFFLSHVETVCFLVWNGRGGP